MSENEKPPALTGGRASVVVTHGERTPRRLDTLSVYARGVKTKGFTPRMGRPDGSGGDRGEIKGWSSASRRRFRQWLLEHEATGDLYGLTLTVPGPTIEAEQWRIMFDRACKALAMAGWGMIWRLEVQTRGQAHIHALATPPAVCTSRARAAAGGVDADFDRPGDVIFWWRCFWDRCLDSLPHCYGVTYVRGEREEGIMPRWVLAGAREHACVVEPDSGSSLWYRYLCDHTSKSKQAQVATWRGFRHWGVVGRLRFRQAAPITHRLEARQFQRVYRWLRMASRRKIPDARCPFGSRRAPSCRRNSQGSAVWFGFTPPVVSRLVDLAAALG